MTTGNPKLTWAIEANTLVPGIDRVSAHPEVCLLLRDLYFLGYKIHFEPQFVFPADGGRSQIVIEKKGIEAFRYENKDMLHTYLQGFSAAKSVDEEHNPDHAFFQVPLPSEVQAAGLKSLKGLPVIESVTEPEEEQVAP